MNANVIVLNSGAYLMGDGSKVPEKLYMDDAAAYLGIAKKTLYNWISKKQGPRRHQELNGRIFFYKQDLDAFKRVKTAPVEAFR